MAKGKVHVTLGVEFEGLTCEQACHILKRLVTQTELPEDDHTLSKRMHAQLGRYSMCCVTASGSILRMERGSADGPLVIDLEDPGNLRQALERAVDAVGR